MSDEPPPSAGQIWTVTHLMTDASPVRHELGRWGAAPSAIDDGVLTCPEERGEAP